ncbi:immunoglobulin superfamily member 3-like [Ascaphus truei]|uniref:immunoglobulin superfamily member 3-like n=1 Tax=Ascaphus truei TaxID=8439 RepID=UPI003F5AA82A
MSRRSRGSMCDGLPPSTQSWLLTTALLLCAGMSWAQRELTLQQGPLYRTVGTHISIWCRVSGYQGPSRQEFLWSVYRPSSPERELPVVSTAGSDFTYAVYSDRVQSGDIYVERVAGDHTLLHIRQLQEIDTGEYECYTPGTETPSLYGTYSGRVNLSGK